VHSPFRARRRARFWSPPGQASGDYHLEIKPLHYRKRRKNHTGPPVFLLRQLRGTTLFQVPFGIQEDSLLFAEKKWNHRSWKPTESRIFLVESLLVQVQNMSKSLDEPALYPSPIPVNSLSSRSPLFNRKKTNKIINNWVSPKKNHMFYRSKHVNTSYMLYGHPSHIGKFCLKLRHNGFNIA